MNGNYVPSPINPQIMVTVTSPDDPAYSLMQMDHKAKTPEVFDRNCYICVDPEFALMGLPLCSACPKCKGHVPADDCVCDECGYDLRESVAARD